MDALHITTNFRQTASPVVTAGPAGLRPATGLGHAGSVAAGAPGGLPSDGQLACRQLDAPVNSWLVWNLLGAPNRVSILWHVPVFALLAATFTVAASAAEPKRATIRILACALALVMPAAAAEKSGPPPAQAIFAQIASQRGTERQTTLSASLPVVAQTAQPAPARSGNAPTWQWQAVPLVPPAVLDAGIRPGGEGGQWPQAICIDPLDGRFLLYGTDVGGIFRSLDGGTHFEPCNAGYTPRGNCGFAIDPVNRNRALAIGANSLEMDCHGIYQSLNQ